MLPDPSPTDPRDEFSMDSSHPDLINTRCSCNLVPLPGTQVTCGLTPVPPESLPPAPLWFPPSWVSIHWGCPCRGHLTSTTCFSFSIFTRVWPRARTRLPYPLCPSFLPAGRRTRASQGHQLSSKHPQVPPSSLADFLHSLWPRLPPILPPAWLALPPAVP